MPSSEILDAVATLAARFVSLAARDDQFRADLRRLAEAVLEATQPAEQPAAEAAPAEAPQTIESAAEAVRAGAAADAGAIAPAEKVESVAELLPALTLGQAPPRSEPAAEERAPRRDWSTAEQEDLGLIVDRCRLKAEGARWAATRQRLLAGGADFATEIEPRDRDIISRARMLPDCYLWMNHPSGPSPANLNLYDDLAGCFDTVADALAVLKQIEDEPDSSQGEFERSLDLLAEAQSALRVALAAIDYPNDRDQLRAFNWLRTATSVHQVFVQRHMRADDPADPTAWEDLAARIEAVDASLQESVRRTKQRRKLIGKVRHKLALIAEDPDDAEDHCEILAETIDELVGDGMPPSNRELRDLLLPAIDDLPELASAHPGFDLVLREIDRFLATSPAPAAAATASVTPEVREAAKALKGKSIVLIGGDHRPAAAQALQDAFKLKDLVWVATREHQSIDGFEAPVSRPDVAVVLLAIRWTSHAFGDVRQFCEKHDKPLVRLPGGYNPNQVAVQILAQCGARLGMKNAVKGASK
ncbi:MAG: hypothetical protein WED34_17975 [Planctomycetales bacterium]